MNLARLLWAVVLSGLIGAAGLAQTAERAPPRALPQSAGVTDDEVDAAVAEGVKLLWSTQNKDTGHFGANDAEIGTMKFPGGNDAMALLALAYAHEAEKPEFQKGLESLQALDLDTTYVLGLRIILAAELYRQADHKHDAAKKTSLRALMTADAKKLAGMQAANGGWDYKASKGVLFDFSNTQLAVLGLQQAALCGVDVSPDVLVKVQKLYMDKQHDDGGWNYGRAGELEGQPSYGSMTAAATASLLITRDLLDPAMGCPCQGEHSPGRHFPQVQAAIDRGVKWLATNFRADTNPKGEGRGGTPYWLYAVERVGVATGAKYLGQHAWYAEGAGGVMGQVYPGRGGEASVPNTSFAVLFLIKGRGPVLMNKVQYDGPWDLHPHDLEWLARYVGETKEQSMTWQVVNLSVPVEELHDAPILFISMENELKLTDAEKQKLRDFTDSGGTILFEASCGNKGVDKAWRKMCQEIWPEWELKRLDKTHPLWTADQKMMALVPLWGLSDGLRTFMFYSPTDLSCLWDTNAFDRNKGVFDLGCNLYAYATDHGKLRGKLARSESRTNGKYSGTEAGKGNVDTITVARIQHGGDWNVGRNYYLWETLSVAADKALGLKIKEAAPVAVGAAIPPETTMLYLNGRTGCDLSTAGQFWLKKYLAGGGFLFAEATLGSKKFDEGFQAAMANAGLTLKKLGRDEGVVGGTMWNGGGGYSVKNVGYTYALRGERIGKSDPELLGVYLGEKLVGVYSPFDIMFCQTGAVAYECRGYAWEDARALAMNVVIYVSTLAAAAQENAANSATSATPAGN